MPKPMDEMPAGWSELHDRDIAAITSNIFALTGVFLRVMENARIPKGVNGHIFIQRRYPDRYSTLFTFDTVESALSWLCGFDMAISCVRLEHAKILYL